MTLSGEKQAGRRRTRRGSFCLAALQGAALSRSAPYMPSFSSPCGLNPGRQSRRTGRAAAVTLRSAYHRGMVTAIVMVQAERHLIQETAEALAAVPSVREVYSVTGEWDIVAIVKLAEYERLDDVVTGHLRKIDGIMRTQTMLAFRTYNEEMLDQGFGIGLDG